jgi:tetratricopeptide (TPR) repeat protein
MNYGSHQTAMWLMLALPLAAAAQVPAAPADTRPAMSTDSSCPAANGPEGDATYPIRKLAFDANAAGNAAEARHLMRCALRANPRDAIALRQEVYLDLNAKDEAGAGEDIDALRAMGASSAQFEAQQGYIDAKAKRYDAARTAFGRAVEMADATGDTKMHAQAMRAIQVLDGEYPSHVFETSIDAQYLSRFNDGIVDAAERYFQRIGGESPFQVYAGARLLRDTASGVGPLPQIFSDNAFLVGPGIAFRPHGAHYTLSAEANAAYVFYGSKNNTGALRSDLRAVAGYYNQWRPNDGRVAFEANGSFGFYSRYQHNGIAYLQPRESFDLLRGDGLRVRPFLQQSVALDTNRDFYNNTVEVIPGIEIGLARYPGVALRGEYVRGYYLPVPATSYNPYGTTYNDFRIRLTFQKNALIRTGAE